MKKNLPFSYRLIAIRKGNQITQVEMARKLGIARQTYLDLETGKTEPRISILYKIAEIFNIPVSAFFEKEQSVSSFISLKKSTDAQLIAELECRLANRRKQKDKE
ncbi:helix-turn-helix transcriptional regulator (plasmid) [Photobacterium damselae]|uniref:helix-turn-helix transcriptional regulator n=1 Tax=Photobacterium damselae TaxID=38293 RepID=UPI0025432283